MDKLKARDFIATSLSIYDFFLLFTLRYLKIQLKINLLILLKEASIEKALLTLHLTTETQILLQKNLKNINVCDALTFLLDNIFIRFGTKL